MVEWKFRNRGDRNNGPSNDVAKAHFEKDGEGWNSWTDTTRSSSCVLCRSTSIRRRTGPRSSSSPYPPGAIPAVSIGAASSPSVVWEVA
eukprot:1366853-Pyramimonas_sp.AAC.1